MEQKRAYKYRFYPTDEQKHLLARTFGCCRYVYNWALRERTDAYYKRGERLYYDGTSERLTALKKQDMFAWLHEVSSVPLQQSLRHLDKAFRNFFEGRAAYPTFHKKHGLQAATYTISAFKWDGQHLMLAKMESPLDIHWSRPLPEGSKPSTVTVTKDKSNRYFVSILLEEEIKPLPVVNKQVGLDLGLKSMVITSEGHSYGNPKFFAKDEKKLAKAERRKSKKKKGSKNRNKARLKVARIHARIADRRRDYQHKLSTEIIRENQIVCVESLSVKNMLKNHKLAKAIADVGWGEFVRQLEYKAQWYGRTLVPLSRLTSSTLLPNAALSVGIFSTPFLWISVTGLALNAASIMTVISTRLVTFWPQGLRRLTAERWSDQGVRKRVLAHPSETVKLTREGERPPSEDVGRMSTPVF